MKKFKRFFWLGFTLFSSVFFAILGIISLFTGELLVGNENNGPSIIIKSEGHTSWLIYTIITFGFSIYLFVWFYNQKKINLA